MYRYREVEDDTNFEYGVVTYLNGENEPVTAEGYVSGSVMSGNDESIAVIAEPERTLCVPFRRVVKIRYPTDD
jgi:hypothetical protein